jgi:hypothetical protein
MIMLAAIATSAHHRRDDEAVPDKVVMRVTTFRE